MLSYLYISARNVAASGLFYDAVLSPTGCNHIFFYPPTGGVTLCISRRWNGGEAVAGNGGMPTLHCVNAIHTAGLRTGGSDAGRRGAAEQDLLYGISAASHGE